MFTFWCYCNDISKIPNFSLLEYWKFNFQRCFSAESEKVVSISIFALVTKKVKWGKHSKKGASGSSSVQFISVQLSCSVGSDSLRPHEWQHTRPPCPSPTPGVHSNSCPSSWWCYPAISSSVIPFSSCPQSFPISGSFKMSQLFAWRGQSTGVSASASFLPMNTQDWSPLGWTGWISLQSKGLSRVFNTAVQ